LAITMLTERFFIEAAACTDMGTDRDNNEDCFYLAGKLPRIEEHIIDTSDVALFDSSEIDFAVYDGLGGESYGEVASRVAAELLGAANYSSDENFCHNYIAAVNTAVLEKQKEFGSKHMGTTAALLHIKGCSADICNIGDSRVYVYHQGLLMRLSEDDRKIDPRTGRSFLTQHIGIPEKEFVIEPHLFKILQLEAGMTFIMCTDGLTDVMPESEMQIFMDASNGKAADIIADELVSAAIGRGSTDNITVLIARIS